MSNKLELTWYGKEKQIRVEPRILIENKELSNTAKDENTENMLIHGDNLLALKALEKKYSGKIKCIYIDPPYNTGSAFEHYDDNLEHSTWLSLMKPRLEILRNLLSDDGSIWISIDDDEGHYLKILCDEIFGRNNFISTVIWEKKYTVANDAKWLSDNHDFILVYAKIKETEIWFGKDGKSIPSRKTFLCDLRKSGVPSKILWRFEEVGHNHEAREEVKAFNSESVFATPKPERLLERILTLGSNENDLVLDSFLGSGTTAAVAHKMNRRYIGIEMGEHAYTHCKVRLDKVIDGSDQGGISKSLNWQGGGGYKFYELAPTLINKDAFDEPIINKDYTSEMLASAVALHEGFEYNPSSETFWKQSVGNENSYLFVTTRHVDLAYLSGIKESMEDNEYLIIACKSFAQEADGKLPNIKIKKIPQMLLDRCEFGKDNYNLNIVSPPVYEDD